MSAFSEIFNWRQSRRATPHTMKFDVKVLLRDGTLETVTLDIPDCTRARDLISTCAVEIYAHHNMTGELSSIAAITQRNGRGHHPYVDSFAPEVEAPRHNRTAG